VIAWRNLWRNRRRTLFTAGSIAFACLLLMFSRSMQLGSYQGMISAATDLLSGHAQLQHRGFLDDPKLEFLIRDASALVERVAAVPGVAIATPRAQAFALLSVDERGFGAQVLGVVPEAERQLSSLPAALTDGRYLEGGAEAVMGASLARNLGAVPGDEVVMLGTGPEGGVAALAVTLVGLFETGQAELDRALVQVPLDVFQAGFFLEDEAHTVILKLERIADLETVAADIRGILPEELALRDWQQLMPDVVQAIALDRVSARMFYGILMLVVLFSIINTFIMTVFERTREFGMLLAIGMRPWRLILMLQLEALWLALLGALIGGTLAIPMLAWLNLVGIPIDVADGMTGGFAFPSHLRGAVAPQQMLLIPLVFVLGCQVSALLPGLRLRRLNPVEALRAD
jgi:ABC-type lipoprotein release transport system permease subunit